MKTIFSALLFLLLPASSSTILLQEKIPYYPNESFDFNLYYGLLKIGVAHLEFNTQINTCDAYIIAEAKSTGIVKYFKDIQYRYEACMDTSTGLPVSDSRTLIEGNYKDINTTYYNHTFREDSSLVYSANIDSFIVPKNIYDLLTGFYMYRVNYIPFKLDKNKSVHITSFFNDEVWDLNISYHGIQKIYTRYGILECYVVKPETVIGYFFKSSDAMSIWITKGHINIPVRFSLDLKIGLLHGELVDFKRATQS
ncbi:MAG: DUF3108 domain-containing protein [Bacteroidales bacterium]|nr:DUF3108 domain-containing protein [Bacteroidales bacterium]MBN2821434.1 DUF3108 domain-containing protein [Bacteroidales bacterium]